MSVQYPLSVGVGYVGALGHVSLSPWHPSRLEPLCITPGNGVFELLSVI